MKQYKKQIPIYSASVIIIFSKDFIADTHKIGIELRGDAKEFDGMCFRHNKKPFTYVIVLSKNASPGTIAHEALHAANYCLQDAGVEVTTQNDEAQAYLLGWVVKQIYKAKKLIQ